MAISYFCSENFNCSSEIVTPDTGCFDYVKKPADINCHFPCLIENCTKYPNEETFCLKYNCIGLLKPASKPNSNSIILTIILSCVSVLFLLTFAGLIWMKQKLRRLRQPQPEEQNLLEGRENTDPETNEVSPSAPPPEQEQRQD